MPVADAAPLLGISPHTVCRLIARDELPVHRVGPRRVYIDTVRLRDLLDPLPRSSATLAREPRPRVFIHGCVRGRCARIRRR
nr:MULTISPECIES: helix-turn-helix domain-containing protein [Mycobacterium]